MPLPKITFILIAFLAGLFSGCDRQGKAVRFILPKDFHGVFQISEDPQTGTDLVTSNGMIIIFVPTDGRVIVKDSSFLSVWHSESAIFPNGKLISEVDFNTNGTVLHDLFSDNNHTNWFLVGTDHEAKIAWSILGEPIPLARQLTDDDIPHYGNQK